MVHCRDGVVRRNVYAGVPQESVLGLLLWNVVYDGLLETLDHVKDTEAVAFADGLTVLFKVRLPGHRREDPGGHGNGHWMV